jgi:hypothetical protein
VIAPDSTSYPYLALAQRLGLDYGLVLRASDCVERDDLTFQEQQEIEMLVYSGHWNKVCRVRHDELLRREVYTELDAAKANGYYNTPEKLRATTHLLVTEDLVTNSSLFEYPEDFDRIRPYVVSWMARESRS